MPVGRPGVTPSAMARMAKIVVHLPLMGVLGEFTCSVPAYAQDIAALKRRIRPRRSGRIARCGRAVE